MLIVSKDYRSESMTQIELYRAVHLACCREAVASAEPKPKMVEADRQAYPVHQLGNWPTQCAVLPSLTERLADSGLDVLDGSSDRKRPPREKLQLWSGV